MTVISLVVCTRNRAAQLGECLGALEQLEDPGDAEVVLVDNGSVDETRELLDRFSQACHLPCRVVAESRPGLSNARNAGWMAARESIVVFTDDDCYPAPSFLEDVRECFRDERIGFLGGRILLHDPDDFPITIQPLAQRVEIPSHSYVAPGLIHGANMAFRKGVLERIGGFDPSLGAGTPCKSGEDADALCRASAAGFPGAYDPRPVVYHHHRRTSSEQVAQLLESYDLGRGALFFKGLRDGETRRQFALPVMRRVAGHLLKARFRTLHREMRGALLYARRGDPAA